MITQKLLHKLFDYDRQTGIFSRKIVLSNASKIGEPLGKNSKNRHINIGIGRKSYRAHRLAWIYVYGEDPQGVVDHINGDPTDNRIDNLRVATQSHNICNSKIPTTNKSGVKGVSWDHERKKWFAKIHYKKKQYALGRYLNFDDAVEVVRKKRLELHGEYARFK